VYEAARNGRTTNRSRKIFEEIMSGVKEVDGDGDDDQEWGEERKENGFEDPDDMQKS
jgi:hypothetical protein